jgi:hypothetical protein
VDYIKPENSCKLAEREIGIASARCIFRAAFCAEHRFTVTGEWCSVAPAFDLMEKIFAPTWDSRVE